VLVRTGRSGVCGQLAAGTRGCAARVPHLSPQTVRATTYRATQRLAAADIQPMSYHGGGAPPMLAKDSEYWNQLTQQQKVRLPPSRFVVLLLSPPPPLPLPVRTSFALSFLLITQPHAPFLAQHHANCA
jgi:hypothetical protein